VVCGGSLFPGFHPGLFKGNPFRILSHGQHPATGTQHPASSIQHPAPSIQHPASSIQNSVPSILIVTSPEHLYRAVLSFRKAGFKKVDGLPAFENTIESDLSFDDSSLGGKKWIPGIGKNLTVRYEFWRQMRYEELILREWMAILYYKLNGWI
jgi:hypothetical protein